MVGRGDELNQLLAAFERMQRGRAQFVSVVGEAGTGKTRLIAEFLARLEADGQLERIARPPCRRLLPWPADLRHFRAASSGKPMTSAPRTRWRRPARS